MDHGLNDKPRDACGIFGIYAPGRDVARLTYYGLLALQHRGQESAGMAVTGGSALQLHKNMGLVSEVFDEAVLASLKGHAAIGHVRYSTTGESSLDNAQPLACHYGQGSLALAHNGNLTNTRQLRESLGHGGAVFQSTADSELILQLVARHNRLPLVEAVRAAMAKLKGAYALVLLTREQLAGVRDPYVLRPLCLGETEEGYVLASESCALDTVGARFLREVAPGEIVTVDRQGLRSFPGAVARQALCVFEYIYLARPDSLLGGQTVSRVRHRLGQELAREYPLAADLVLPVPDSGLAPAVGYAEASGLPLDDGLVRNRYVGRTFIQPSQQLRELGVRLKLNPIRTVLAGKSVALVDDSLVRGTTGRKLVQLLKEAGAREVHLLLASPPVLHPCYYGIDMASREELLAARYSIPEIQRHLGADGLHYLSLAGLRRAVGLAGDHCCLACLTGEYPEDPGLS